MIDLEFTKAVNPDLLHEQIAAVIGAQLIGISTGPEKRIRVHLLDDTLPKDQNFVVALVAAHDSTQLTTSQQQAAAQTALIASLRKPWDQWTEADKDTLLRLLAERL